MIQYLTSFADQALILPLVVAVACALAALGWRRGALAWLFVIAATFGVVLALKVAAVACGPPALRSPSGHTAAAAIVLGGLAVILSRGRRRYAVPLAAGFGAVVIGLSRLALHVHTVAEVALGGVVGIAGALVLARLAGPPPRLRLFWLVAVVAVTAAVFHGFHLNAEPRIDRAALDLGICPYEPPLLTPAHLRMLRHPFRL